MQLEFIGADHEVTGSCHYIKVGNKNILIDCGMKQGREIYKSVEIPVRLTAWLPMISICQRPPSTSNTT